MNIAFRPQPFHLLLASCLPVVLLLPRPSAVSAKVEPRQIEVTAKRFAYIPGDITLHKGEPVVLVLHSADVAHGVKFDDLGLQSDIGKGSTARLAFTPDHTGIFVGHCSHFCGSGHGSMTLTLHVTE